MYPYFKEIQSGPGPEASVDGRSMIMIGSNNYLGLNGHPKVIEAAKAAIDKYGTGCTGSRFLNGTLDLHAELEDRLAKFLFKEKAICFTTGFQANQGALSAIIGKNDVVFSDRANHASIVDGYRLSFGKVKKYRHNDLGDLERCLLHEKDKDTGKLIVTDAVFSMEGDIINLPKMVDLAHKYSARIYVDEAHSLGVLGKYGRGIEEHFDLMGKVDLSMGTFSKSFASVGGFIAGSKSVIDYLKHHSRTMIFSASLPPASVATVIACIDILESEPERVEMLWNNTYKMLDGFKSLGFDTGKSETPIIPIIIGKEEDCLVFWKALFENGIFANPAISPAVLPGKAIIRTSYMATHSHEILDRVLDVFARVGKSLGII